MGWMPVSLLSDTISLKKDKQILITFKTTQSIVGQVDFSPGAYSIRGNMRLEGLRIVAESDSEKEFDAITNEEGVVFLNLVHGNYTIKMPESIQGGKFKFDNLSQQVEVSNATQKPLIFTLKEKRKKDKYP